MGTWRRGDEAGETEGSSVDVDGLLLVRARTDMTAFGQFYDRNQAAVLRYFVTQTGDAHLAGELAAETFAVALSGVHRFDPHRGSAAAWLFGIAGNLYHRFLRRGAIDQRYRRAHGIPSLAKSDDDLERIEALADLGDVLTVLRAALEGLSPAVRAAVELRVAHDLPYEEVASRLGCTVGSARVRVARGMKQLMVAMGVEGAR